MWYFISYQLPFCHAVLGWLPNSPESSDSSFHINEKCGVLNRIMFCILKIVFKEIF